MALAEGPQRQGKDAGGWPCRLVALGRSPYLPALAMQRRLAEGVRLGAPAALMMVEHPHTYTLGTRSRPEHLLISPEEAAAEDAQVVQVDRGGSVTYHGPGQIVAYPIFDVRRRFPDLHQFLRKIEEAVIVALARWDLPAQRVPGLTGVWVGGRKIAAIGVRIRRGVSTHGLALNVRPDLGRFSRIVPCGIRGRGVTSMAAELGRTISMTEAASALAESMAGVFGCRLFGGRAWAEAPGRLPLGWVNRHTGAWLH